jgi:nucleoside-diphosphate-sugar epimerase
MKVGCVTGATGCIGRILVDQLVFDGWDVVVLHRKSSDLSRLKGCRVRFREVDLYDPVSAREGIPRGADAIFHAAANTSHWARDAAVQWKDNVLATRNLVDATVARGVKRFVFTSTGATLGHQGADERDVRRVRNGYVRSKRLAGLEVSKAMGRGLDAVVRTPAMSAGLADPVGSLEGRLSVPVLQQNEDTTPQEPAPWPRPHPRSRNRSRTDRSPRRDPPSPGVRHTT